MSQAISQFMTQDHRKCDEVFSELENRVLKKNFDGIEDAFKEFSNDFLKHFRMEEEIMFPAFEERTGMSEGPTQIMRMEHLQMKQVIAQMENDIQKKDYEHFLGLSETFIILVQQHNAKEEQMLYNMMDQALIDLSDELIKKMSNI